MSRSGPGAFGLALLAAIALCARVQPVAADAELRGLGARDVSEVSHEISIELGDGLARVEVTQVLANGADRDAEAIYRFDLPPRAVITGLDIQLADGRKTTSAAVDAEAAVRSVYDPDGTSGVPDVGLVRMVESIAGDAPGAHKRYELRVFPIMSKRTARVVVHWLAPVDVVDGRWSLRIPGRGVAPNLAREQLQLRLHHPGGFSQVFAGGQLLAGKASARARFSGVGAPALGDLIIQATPGAGKSRTPQPLAAVVPVGPEGGIVGLIASAGSRVVGSAQSFDRAVFVIDVSRSVGASGLAHIRALVDSVVQGLGSAHIEVVAFDRDVTELLGGLTPANRNARATIDRSLTRASLRNGSDLGAALDRAGKILAQGAGSAGSPSARAGRTLLVIVTDGLVPLALDGDQAVELLGAAADDLVAMSVVVVPDGAPVPPLDEGPLVELASRTGGRVFAVRQGDIAERAPMLLAQLAEPAPISALDIDTGSTAVTGWSIPGSLTPGSGFVALGYYRGLAPSRVALTGRLGGAPTRIEARRIKGKLAADLARLAVGNAGPGDFGSTEEDATSGVAGYLQGRRLQIAAAARLGVVSTESALVAVDGRDAFARDRLALASRWGGAQYRRHLPPPERTAEHVFDKLEQLSLSGREREWMRVGGQLDASILRRLVRAYVIPRARACYEQRLRGDRGLAGQLTLEIEMARSEVQYARILRATPSLEVLSRCVAESAYSIPVPSVKQGDNPEVISVVRYALTFRSRAGKGQVAATKATQPGTDTGAATSKEPARPGAIDIPSSDDPLDGIPD